MPNDNATAQSDPSLTYPYSVEGHQTIATHLRLIAAYLAALALIVSVAIACWWAFGALPPFSS